MSVYIIFTGVGAEAPGVTLTAKVMASALSEFRFIVTSQLIWTPLVLPAVYVVTVVPLTAATVGQLRLMVSAAQTGLASSSAAKSPNPQNKLFADI
jgi:hypothetical protein